MTSIPCWRASRGLWIATGCAVDEDLAGVGGVRARQRVHQRRLAGAVAADEADDLAGVEVDADAVDGVDAAEGHADVAQLDERRLPGCGRGVGLVEVSVMRQPPLDHGRPVWMMTAETTRPTASGAERPSAACLPERPSRWRRR